MAFFSRKYPLCRKNETAKFDLDLSCHLYDLSCQRFGFSCKSIIFKKATPQTESSEAHSFLFNYRNYESYERSDNTDYRNGSKPKKPKSTYGEIPIDVPQDRDGNFMIYYS